MAKKYSLEVVNDEVVAIEIDGVRYDYPSQIPDPEDRAKVTQMIAHATTPDLTEADLDLDEFEDFPDFDHDPESTSETELERDLDAALGFNHNSSLGNVVTTADTDLFPKIILSIFFAVSLLLLTITALTSLHITRRLSREKIITGQVVEIVSHTSKDTRGYESTFYYPIVKYCLPDDRCQTVEIGEGGSSPQYQSGDPITIAYDSAYPNRARIYSSSSLIGMWILPAITGLIGSIFLIMVLFAAWVMRPKRTNSIS